LRVWLAVSFVLAAAAQAQAQQTVTQPPPASPPSTFPQFQTYNSCLMNCDTRAGTCQGTCSVSNSPALTFAAPPSATNPSATRTDSSVAVPTLAQCYLSCSTQALVCKRACTPPH
jgi:hypothetical protein